MSKTYDIAHISDLLLVPADKIDDCLADIAIALAAARLALALEPKPADRRVVLDRITWIDDGQRETTCELPGGASIRISKDAP